VDLVLANSFCDAGIGPVSIGTGSLPTNTLDTMRAFGCRPSSLAFSAVINNTAPEPSEICDDVPAV